MQPAKKFNTTMRAAVVAGITAFASHSAVAQNENVAPKPETSADRIAIMNNVSVTAVPLSDKLVLNDGKQVVVADCASIRPPKGLDNASGVEIFKDLQAATVIWADKPTAAETKAARGFVDRMHTACGPKPARVPFGKKQ